jgi:hypothetical protein
MKQYLWMIRAIHARSDGSRFVDDVAQCGGKNSPHFRSCKDVGADKRLMLKMKKVVNTFANVGEKMSSTLKKC